SSRRRHTRFSRDWSSDVCSSDLSFSNINEDFNDPAKVTDRKVMSADEVYFLKAEAALRGWAGAGDAQANYEAGVRASFELWGARSEERRVGRACSSR